MALIENIGEDWSDGVALSSDEGWQCRQGAVLVSTEDSGSEDRGIRLESGQSWPFPAGVSVYYRRVSGPGATIAREVIA